MNSIYRLVWNMAQQCWVVAPECARARGKGGKAGRSGRAALRRGAGLTLAWAGLAASGTALAQSQAPVPGISPAGGRTEVYLAPNGVPVVNIDTANGAGLSHNKFLNYQVPVQGLVLNNADASEVVRQSRLAGQILANLNLPVPARVILNEVVAPSATQLLGFTEVLGSRADVVLANPWGITCSGCGFLNTDRVTLSTGVPTFGADGGLSGFQVGRGHIAIDGDGIDATGQQVLDLVARSVALHGRLAGGAGTAIGVFAGPNVFAYAQREVTGTWLPEGERPLFALDAGALGAMYGGAVRIVATEAGVGVRMSAEAAASGDDFSLSAAGKVELRASLSAARDLRVSTSSSSGEPDLDVQAAQLTSGRDLALSAGASLALVDGQLVAGRDLQLSAPRLDDRAAGREAQRAAGRDLLLSAPLATTIDGPTWRAEGEFSIATGALTIGANGAALQGGRLALAAEGDLALGGLSLQATDDLALSSRSGSLTIGGGAAQGLQTTRGTLRLSAARDLVNDGTVSADAGALSLAVGGAIVNRGTLHAGSALTLEGREAGSRAARASNLGLLLGDGSLTLRAAEFDNAEGATASAGDVVLATDNSANAGHLLARGSLAWTTATLANRGTVLADGALSAQASGAVSNSGAIDTRGSATLSAAAWDNAGRLLADGAVQLSTATFTNTGTLQTRAGLVLQTEAITNSGVLHADGALQAQAQRVDNTGTLASRADMALVAGAIDNAANAQLLAEGGLRTDGDSLANAGRIEAGGAVALVARAGVSNSGNLSSTAALQASGGNLDNRGTLQAQAGLALAFTAVDNTGTLRSDGALASSGQTFVNRGELATADALDIQARSLRNSGRMQAGAAASLAASADFANTGSVIASGALDGRGATLANAAAARLQGSAVALAAATTLSNAGEVLASAGLSASATRLANTGVLQGASFAASAADSSNSGSVRAASTLAWDADTLANSGQLEAGTALSARVDRFEQTGSSLAGGDLAVQARTSLVSSGRLQAGGELAIGVAGVPGPALVLNAGSVTQGGRLAITSADVTLASSAQLQSVGAATVQAEHINLANGTRVRIGGDLSLRATALNLGGSASALLSNVDGGNGSVLQLATAFTNPGLLHAGADLTIEAPAITNADSGGIGADGHLRLSALDGGLTNRGALFAGQSLSAQASTVLSNLGTATALSATIDAGTHLSLSAPTVRNESSIGAGGDITIRAAQFHNELPGGDTRIWRTVNDTGEVRSDFNRYVFPDLYTDTTIRRTWRHEQVYAGGTPQVTPQLIGGGTVSILGFDTATNLGAVLSGAQVVLEGQAGASFTNSDLPLQWEQWHSERRLATHWIALGPGSYSRDVPVSASGDVMDSAGVASARPAGIFAGTLTATGFTLVNAGSPYGTPPAQASAPAIAAAAPAAGGAWQAPAAPSPMGGAIGRSPVAAASGAAGAASLAPSFPGLKLSLPSNPNGKFVVAQDPNAKYLVESNPVFGLGQDFIGSDYMANRLGFDPDNEPRRLGDANYEASLIQQQLVAQIGRPSIDGLTSLAEQVQQLMDGALAQAGNLGLTYGQAPTTEQLENLREDIVWMVSTVVNGQTVLAPVVYLAASTRASIDAGPQIVASSATLALESMRNTGGTVAAASLDITTRGDLTNTSGTIRGGDVSLKSTEGSIINQTAATTTGNLAVDANTVLGRTAGIQATQSLSLDAAKNITNLGANMSAGGDATLKAGGDIRFDTVEDKRASTRSSSSQGWGGASSETSTTTSTTQVKSGLTVGGNLDAKSGGDITLAGTDARVGGDAKLDAGKALNIVARENVTETKSSSKTEGFGVGGGVWGTEETTKESYSSRNVGSTLNIGGNADLKAAQDLTLQGSNLAVGGDARIEANDVKVLAGKDVDRSSTTTKSTTWLGNDGSQVTPQEATASASGSGSGQTEGQASADANKRRAQASAEGKAGGSGEGSAEAGTGVQATAGVTLARTVESNESTLSQRSVGSAISIGGNAAVKAREGVTLQGSTLDAGGDVQVDAKNIALLAAQNIEETKRSTTTTSIGLYAASDNSASAGASASGEAEARGAAKAGAAGLGPSASAEVGASGQAGGQAQAEASSKNTVDVARIEKLTEEARDVTNTGSAIRSGGAMSLKAQEQLRTVGSSLESGGAMALDAKDMRFEEARDESTRSTSRSLTTVGVYVDAEAKASAGASASTENEAQARGGLFDANGSASASAEGQAGAEASARIGAGIQVKNTTETTTDKSTTARTSSIKSGGDLTRTASGSITDVGTAIDVGGNLTQSAETIRSLAARNTQSTTTTTESTTARIGIYAEASASAEASGSAKAEAEGGAWKKGEAKAEAEGSAKAQASAGAGYDASLERTTSSTQTEASQAVASTIRVGGAMKSSSTKATELEGTKLDAGGDVELNAGSLDIRAARDTEKTTSSSETITARASVGVAAEAKAEAKGSASTEDGASVSTKSEAGLKGKAELEAGYAKSESSRESSTAQVAALAAGGKLKINSGGAATMEGTQLAGAQGVEINAESLNFKAAANTLEESSKSTQVDAKAAVDVPITGSGGDLALEGNVKLDEAKSKSSEAVAGAISGGAGNVSISTRKDMRLEGTQVGGDGDVNLAAGGNVTVDAARSTSESSSQSIGAGAKLDTENKAFGISGSFEKSTETSSQAVTGTLAAGKSLNIVSGGNVSLEGTALSAGQDASIAAAGNVDMKAARNESSASSTSFSASLGTGSTETKNKLDGSTENKDTAGVELSLGIERSSSSEAVAGSVNAGNKLAISAGGNASFEGTALSAGNAASVAAGGDVNFKAAESRSDAFSIGIGLAGGIENKSKTEQDAKEGDEGEKSAKREGSLSFDASVESSRQRQGSTLSAGDGGIQVSAGRNLAMEGTQLDTSGQAALAAGGSITRRAALSSEIQAGVGFDLAGEKETSTEDGKTQTERKGSTTIREATLEGSNDAQNTTIQAAGGTRLSQRAAPPPVAFTMNASVDAEGFFVAQAPVPADLPPNAQVLGKLADGSPLPPWLTVDARTGKLQGKPPADFSGGLTAVIAVPKADGSTMNIAVKLGP